jgi:glycosyltransferase involved in cell wall biosynthesis
VVVVSASRLHSEKGVDNNLIAFKKFNERVKNSYYLICGDGVEKDNLLQLSKDLGIISNVRFLGGIDRKFLSNILNCADIFLFLTKRVEGLPLNVLEAMSVGVPMIVSNHLTFTESNKLRKVVNNEYEHIADQMVGVVNFSNGGKNHIFPLIIPCLILPKNIAG